MTSSTSNSTRTALVTGATSGLGLEAAALLAEQGFNRVIITGRTLQRAAEAKNTLVKRTGKGIFMTIALDLGDKASVAAAAEELSISGHSIDLLLLNAGMVSGNTLTKTDEGVEITYASSLIGHHRLTMDLLSRRLLATGARIVISGSEAARGDVPTFNPVALPTFAQKYYEGDLVAAAERLITHDAPIKYKPATTYATAKLFVAYWAVELATRLPDGMTVNAVSPGSAPATDAGRNANFFMRNVMMRVMKAMPKSMGLAAPVAVAAQRYVDAGRFGADVTGHFFASAPKKMTGPLHRVELDHILDRVSSRAAWAATVNVAGVDAPVSA